MVTSHPHQKQFSRRDFLKFSGAMSLGLALSACDLARVNLPQGAMWNLPVTLADIMRAEGVVKGVALQTPLVEEYVLSKLCGAQVYLKLENLQRTGSFKIRGAYNKITNLSDAQRTHGVIAASAGNHANSGEIAQ